MVIGAQSSSKSSVLGGLIDLPFPRNNRLRIRFATQIPFRQAEKSSITVSIIPLPTADSKIKKKLRAFKINYLTLPYIPLSTIVTADSVSPKPGLSDSAAVDVFIPRSSRSLVGRLKSSGSLTHPIRLLATLLLNSSLLKPYARHLVADNRKVTVVLII